MKLFAAGLVVVVPFASNVWAQSAIAPPQMGFVQDSAHSLRPAYGVAGSFILGPPIAEKVVSQAFSGSLGLVKTGSSLAAFDRNGKLLASADAAAGPAFFAFSPNGARGLAYIPSSNALLEWRGHAFVPVSVNLEQITPNSVLAIAFPTLFQESFLIETSGGIWEVHLPLDSQGTFSQSALNGIHAPLLALPSGDLVYGSAEGIVIRKANASEVHVAASLPAHFSLHQMNGEWVQLKDLNSSGHFALRTAAGREAFYQLPETGR